MTKERRRRGRREKTGEAIGTRDPRGRERTRAHARSTTRPPDQEERERGPCVLSRQHDVGRVMPFVPLRPHAVCVLRARLSAGCREGPSAGEIRPVLSLSLSLSTKKSKMSCTKEGSKGKKGKLRGRGREEEEEEEEKRKGEDGEVKKKTRPVDSPTAVFRWDGHPTHDARRGDAAFPRAQDHALMASLLLLALALITGFVKGRLLFLGLRTLAQA